MSGRREMREREVELISQGRLWGKEKKKQVYSSKWGRKIGWKQDKDLRIQEIV